MASTNQPIQALSDALSTLESRVSALEPTSNGINTLKEESSATTSKPIQLLQDRILKLGNRIYTLECNTESNGEDATDSTTSTTSTPQPLCFLRGIIGELVNRVDTLEEAGKDDGGDGGEEEEEEEEEEEQPSTDVLLMYLTENTGASWAVDYATIRIKSEAPPHKYCQARIVCSPINMDTTTDWYEIPTNEYITLWRRGESDSQLSGDVSITLYVCDNADGSGDVYYNTQTLSSSIYSHVYIKEDQWTLKVQDEPEPEPVVAVRMYTFPVETFGSRFQANSADDDDSNDKIELTEYSDGTYKLTCAIHNWDGPSPSDATEGQDYYGIVMSILAPERLRTSSSNPESYISKTHRLYSSGTYRVDLDSEGNPGLWMRYTNRRSTYDGTAIQFSKTLSLDDGVSLVINKKKYDSTVDTDDKVVVTEYNN